MPKKKIHPTLQEIIIDNDTNETYYQFTTTISEYFQDLENHNPKQTVVAFCDRMIGYINQNKNRVMREINSNHGNEWIDSDVEELDELFTKEKYDKNKNSIKNISLNIADEMKRSPMSILEALQKRVVIFGDEAGKKLNKPAECINILKIINQNKKILSLKRIYKVRHDDGEVKNVKTNKYSKK